MRAFALLAASITITVLPGTIASAQRPVASSQTYTCPKCGKLHVRPVATAARSTVTTRTQSRSASRSAPVTRSSSVRSTGGVINVLAALNAQRARQGISSLRYDPQLQAVAERRAQIMASRRLKSHPPGSFAPGRYEGVGWSSSYSPSGVSACYTRDRRMQFAGAAMATGSDGVYFAVVYR